ncbi:hypothetical protein Pcinc_017224 [Petrolisthes cinctipes]|uniref:Aladin seven-bladed propeller domain-containing protein n=1 Tax=Petrolisthes cinctipes TaxID=88211 RepID=A0AAE1FPI9_PETCI|nr:hypothetical protein Pcinc_017224 [Petrolisthes cinctipes]
MITLEHLPPPPVFGQVTAFENDGRLQALLGSEALITAKKWLGEGMYIEVEVGQEPVRTAHSKQEAREAFYAHTETPWQRVMFAYYEEGWEAAVHEMIKCRGEGSLHDVASTVASLIIKMSSLIAKVHTLLPSPKKIKAPYDVAQDRGRCDGSIVSVAWHPNTNTLAAVICDDTVRVFTAGQPNKPILKHRLQKSITSIAWMPFSALVLAVGCEAGVLLWHLDPLNAMLRPSGSCATFLPCPGTSPITTLSWHPRGNVLVCAGGSSSQVVVWDVWREVSVVVHSGSGGTVTLAVWSPDSSRLFVAYSSKIMRVFETHGWNYEQWSVDSPVVSAVWSRRGHLLLFVTQEDPVLYHLAFLPGEGVGGTQVAAQVADLTQIAVATLEGDQISVGGAVKQIAWDPRSERLAVVFHNSQLLALFHTHTHPSLHLAPGGFICGEPGCVPVTVSFQQNLSSGAVLSVVWSSGKVTHLPMRYSSRDPLAASFIHNTSLSHAHSTTLPNTSFTVNSFFTNNVSPISSPLTGRLFSSP